MIGGREVHSYLLILLTTFLCKCVIKTTNLDKHGASFLYLNIVELSFVAMYDTEDTASEFSNALSIHQDSFAHSFCAQWVMALCILQYISYIVAFIMMVYFNSVCTNIVLHLLLFNVC